MSFLSATRCSATGCLELKEGVCTVRLVRVDLISASSFLHESLKHLDRKQSISIVPLSDKSGPCTKSHQPDIILTESHDATDSNLEMIAQRFPTSKIGMDVLTLVRSGVVGFLF
jgi:hypothetical protein